MNVFPLLFRQQFAPAFQDGHGREIGYLRISVVDRCNLRCHYCRPETGQFHALPREKILRFEEIERVARLAISLGVEKIRITGGEPLVRKGLIGFIERLSALPGLRDLTLSTNAILLKPYAQPLYDAGVKRINISLDTLDAPTFAQLTGGRISDVLAGIDAAQTAGFTPIRINAVLMKDNNITQATELIDFCARQQLELRFIELMPMREGMDWQQHYYPISAFMARPEIIERINFDIITPQGNAAARYFPLRDGTGRVGFIEPMSRHFCAACNRLRLTADGKLRPCLSADNEVDLRASLRNASTDDDILQLIRQTTAGKQATSTYVFDQSGRQRSMIAIGG